MASLFERAGGMGRTAGSLGLAGAKGIQRGQAPCCPGIDERMGRFATVRVLVLLQAHCVGQICCWSVTCSNFKRRRLTRVIRRVHLAMQHRQRACGSTLSSALHITARHRLQASCHAADARLLCRRHLPDDGRIRHQRQPRVTTHECLAWLRGHELAHLQLASSGVGGNATPQDPTRGHACQASHAHSYHRHARLPYPLLPLPPSAQWGCGRLASAGRCSRLARLPPAAQLSPCSVPHPSTPPAPRWQSAS